jgi:DmsE family decaheme c-type cytochrome
MACHNTPEVNQILKTPHARQADHRTPFATHGCESCHGPSLEHLSGIQSDGKRLPPQLVLGTQSKNYPVAPTTEQNKVCLDCHSNRSNQNWHGSQHQFADLSCSSCHTMHTAKDAILEKTSQAKVCYQCHTEQRAQSHRPFGHPLAEGSMTCSDCHNPHGAPGPALLVNNTINETCYRCHAEKRGPFLWEHQPVREDCMNCHDAHGTTQPAMLRVRTPFLCNMCHSENFHPSTLRSGTGVPPFGAGDNLLGRGCSNCHSQVHGSNHPSGTGLTR